MSKKLIFVCALCLFAAMVSSANAWSEWMHYDGNNALWSNANNWNPGGTAPPGSADDADIWLDRYTVNGTAGPTIDSAATCKSLKFRSGVAEIVTGGSLVVTNWADVGSYQAGGYSSGAYPNSGKMTISGTGSLSCLNSRFYVGNYTDGLLIMKDSATLNTINFRLGAAGGYGQLQLIGGTANVTSLYIPEGDMVIYDGTMIITNTYDDANDWQDHKDLIDGYIGDGTISTWGSGSVSAAYNINPGTLVGVTTITPEPATIALLGLGGAVVFRRKRWI
jgi:hypothetical protein